MGTSRKSSTLDLFKCIKSYARLIPLPYGGKSAKAGMENAGYSV